MTHPLANFTTPIDWVVYAGTVTSGMFWNLILISIFVMSFGMFIRKTSVERSFSVTSFVCGILSIFLYILGGIDGWSATVWLALSFAGFILLLFVKN